MADKHRDSQWQVAAKSWTGDISASNSTRRHPVSRAQYM
jgi:hypothetical protein